MSTKDATAFREKIAKSPALQNEVAEAIRKDPNGGVVALGRAHGFEFTGQEVLAVLEGSELSDFELGLVAGGVNIGAGGDCGGQVMPGQAQSVVVQGGLTNRGPLTGGGGGFTGGV
jgi:predicted ribosomally synthesized peptide with nif11-like leader